MATKNLENRKVDFSKAPEGFRYAPMVVTKDVVREWNLDRDYVTYHRIGSRLHLCYMTLIPEEMYHSYMADMKAEDKRLERENRCLITSPKTGRLIMCPEYNKCCDCKLAGDLKMQKNRSLSLDEMFENNIYEEAATSKDPAEEVMASITEESLLQELDSIDPKLGNILRLRLNVLEPKAIMDKLNIKRSTFYDDMKRIAKVAEKYL